MEIVRFKTGAPVSSDFRSDKGALVVDTTTGGARIYAMDDAGNIAGLGAEVYSVTSFGAIGNGSADDSSAIQDCVDACYAAGGGVVFIPPGTYKIATAVTIPNFVEIVGVGEVSLFRASGNNFCLSFSPGNRSAIRNVAFDAASTQASGGAIDFTDMGNNIRISDIYLGSKLYCGLNITPASTAGIIYADRVRWNGIANCTYGVVIGDGTNLVTDVYLSNFSGTASSQSSMVTWIEINNNSDTVVVSNSIFIYGGTGGNGGITVGQNATGTVTGCRFNQVIVDWNDSYGFNVAKCRDLEFNGCSAQTCAYGLGIGANATGLKWRGGIVQNNTGTGITAFAGSSHWEISNATISDNNTSNGAFGHGIDVAAAVSNWRVVNCTSGNYLLATGFQVYGLQVSVGASDYYWIQGNRWIGNGTAGLADNGTGVNKVVADNI